MLPEWVGDYVGIPFAEHGRTREGCDCYGLVRLVLGERFGKTLPVFADGYDDADPAEEARLIDERLPLVGARLVPLPALGDIVLMRFFGVTAHVGVYLGHHRVLHTMRGRDAHVDDLESASLASRIVGYYRVD